MMSLHRQRHILSQYVLSEALATLEESTSESELLLEQGLAIADHRARWPRGVLPEDIYVLVVAGFLRLARNLAAEKAEFFLVACWNVDELQKTLFELSAESGEAAWKFADELLRGLSNLTSVSVNVDNDVRALLRQSKFCAAKLIADPAICEANVAVLCAVLRCVLSRVSSSSIEDALVHAKKLSESVLAEVDAQASLGTSGLVRRAATNIIPSLRDPFCTKEIASS